MAFVKRTLTPINTRVADALFDFEEPYIQSGIISGKIYTFLPLFNDIRKYNQKQSSKFIFSPSLYFGRTGRFSYFVLIIKIITLLDGRENMVHPL